MFRERFPRGYAIAAALVFTIFLTAHGIPTLRHDWNWPIDRAAVPSFIGETIGGWIDAGFGALGAHPTTYLIAIPLSIAFWIFGPLIALMLFAGVVGYACMRAGEELAQRFGCAPPAGFAVGIFALFNPWVYNEVVAGHLVMVLAYAGVFGLIAEMLRGAVASPVRLALWLALVEVQLQLFIVAMLAAILFAARTRKWLVPLTGLVLALPSIVGLFAESGTIVKTPYILEWQSNQSVLPAALSALNGYFAGYSERLGLAAAIAVWMILVLAAAGAVVARHSRTMLAIVAAAAVLFAIVTGVHGPLGAAYEWMVRSVPQSGVFRELYDLAGVFAALVATLACAAIAAFPYLRYVSLAAAIALVGTWISAPPSGFWIGAQTYPHPSTNAREFTRVALLPAFQPLTLRSGGGDGADPDAHVYRGNVVPLNEYLPSYPVDMALARYEQEGNVSALQALGVSQIVPRPWLASLSHGTVGLAASSLAGAATNAQPGPDGLTLEAMPLISQCAAPRVVALGSRLNGCDIFFGDAAGGYPKVRPVRAASDSIDARSDWIDARLAFAAVPALAQGIGGVVTQSGVPFPIEPGALLAYVRGRLLDQRGATIASIGRGAFRWIPIPAGVTSLRCAGLCELVAQTQTVPRMEMEGIASPAVALSFSKLAPWLYVVGDAIAPAALLRFNARFDRGWIALDRSGIVPHVRVDMAVNGWIFHDAATGPIVLLQVTSFLQMIAELCGIVFVLWLLKALLREPTKRARR